MCALIRLGVVEPEIKIMRLREDDQPQAQLRISLKYLHVLHLLNCLNKAIIFHTITTDKGVMAVFYGRKLVGLQRQG
jgi:hypothetical protein